MRIQGTFIATVVLTLAVNQPTLAQVENGGVERPAVPNELLLTGVGEAGKITIYEYREGSYQEAWSTTTSDVFFSLGGGEAGDLTGDGVPEFVLERSLSLSGGIYRLEVWSFDATAQGWYRLWSSAPGGRHYVGDILDFDDDGANEILVTDRGAGRLQIYSFNGMEFEVEATVADCSATNAYYHATGGDLDGDGTPEILFQCSSPDDLIVYEYDQINANYPIVAAIPVPIVNVVYPMTVDDMETGDVNGDGLVDAVFCGNSGSAHVLTYTMAGYYEIEFNSPPPIGTVVFSQTCSVGDVTNDGHSDILVVNDETVKVFSYLGAGYQEVWQVAYPPDFNPPIAGSFVGDADNDGFTEFVIVENGYPDPWNHKYQLFEDDVVGANAFVNTLTFAGAENYLGTIIIGNLNPTNDALVFSDDFELGDTLAWALTVP